MAKNMNTQGQKTTIIDGYSNRSEVDGDSLLDTLKSLVFSWVKEAVTEAIREQNQDQIHYPEKVSIVQACEITGYSRTSLYQMHSKGTIPGALKVGGKLLFDTATLRRWVEEGGNSRP